MTAAMSAAAWQRTEQLARQAGLSDAQIAGLAIGCPAHGNASMDFDDDGIFCGTCDRALAAHQAAQAGACSHGGHGWDGEICSDISVHP